MKKIILLAVAFVSFATITSCSNDDDQASLQGKWEYLKEGTANSSGQEDLVDYQHQAGCSKDYSIITASSIVDHSFFGSTCEEEIFSTPYTRNGNTISITVEGETFTAEIKTLDSSTLKIYSIDPEFPGIIDVTVFKRIN
jgi:hypothetical protein